MRMQLWCLTAGAALAGLVALQPGAANAAPQGNEPQDQAPQGVIDAFRQGTPRLNFLYRYEYVGDDAIEKDAHASTLRTALSYRTAPLRGFVFFIEAENVVEANKREIGQSRSGGIVAVPLNHRKGALRDVRRAFFQRGVDGAGESTGALMESERGGVDD